MKKIIRNIMGADLRRCVLRGLCDARREYGYVVGTDRSDATK